MNLKIFTTVAALLLSGFVAPTLHPKSAALPFAHQGPFVTTGDGGVLCVDAEHAMLSSDDGKTWTTNAIFRDLAKYQMSNERALLRTRDGVVIAAWMNLRERKAPEGWGWGKEDVNWEDFVLPTDVCRSLDDGKTWEEPTLLNKPWCGCIHSMIQTKSGGIVMFGDSTTAERPGVVQKVYAQRVEESLQSIGSSLSVHNAGAPSHTTRDAKKRLAHDVLAHEPRVVVIMFGINDAAVDVWKKPPATESRVPLADYEANLRWMITTMREQKVKPVLMTTNPLRWTGKLLELYGKPPYRPDDADGFDAPVLARYNDVVRRLARELAVPLVEVHDVLAAKNPEKLLLDGMHPNDAGHALIAELLVPVIREQLR